MNTYVRDVEDMDTVRGRHPQGRQNETDTEREREKERRTSTLHENSIAAWLALGKHVPYVGVSPTHTIESMESTETL